MARVTARKAILKADAENTEVQETEVKKQVEEVRTISKSRKRTSLDEFAIVNNIRPEVKAGFKAWLDGQYYHFDEEWKTLFENYNRR